jgi:hypothetical protein
VSPAEYCREIETYLCRKNDGHLIRIVGPVFEKVCGWAAQGVPIRIAYRGIDRYFERHQAKGPRRRPVRVEFCEADILDVFDEWRRAVGVAGRPNAGDAQSVPASDVPAGANGARGLLTHIDRVMARLTQRRIEIGDTEALADVVDRALSELDAMRAHARGARGDARAALVDRLAVVDRELVDAARAAAGSTTLAELQGEALRDLEPFRSRLAPDAFREATEAALDRLVRDRCRLPSVRVEG